MPVVPVTQQTEHRVKEQSLKHESPLSGADVFTLLVESDSKTKEIVEELVDVQGLLASVNRSTCNGHQTPVPCRDACIS